MSAAEDLNYHRMVRKLFFNMSVSLGNCELRVEPKEPSIFGIKGESLTMQWNIINKNASYSGTQLYLGKKIIDGQRLYSIGLTSSEPGPKLISHFGNRSKPMLSNNAFKLQINNLQYSDQASYLFRVVLADAVLSNDASIITIVNITGKHGII